MEHSVKTMLDRIVGLLGTNDLNDWETRFVRSVSEQAQGGTTNLSGNQVEKIRQIFVKHFAG